MKKEAMIQGILLVILSAILLMPMIQAQDCDFDPECLPKVRECGCGGTQTRYTLCEGGCSEWYPCSVADTETSCTDNQDNDCDGKTDCEDEDCVEHPNCKDEDNDGFSTAIDCNDRNPEINPEAEEKCNSRDDNCNGLIDEDLERECGVTETGICTIGKEQCINGQWQGCTAALPEEERCDGLDNDCDGTTDEGCSCTEGETRQCGTTNIGTCEYGTQTCTNGAWGECQGNIEPETEQCGDNQDNDCDGEIDEGCQYPEETIEELQKPIQEPEPLIEEQEEVEAEPIIPTRPCIDEDGDGYGINCRTGQDCNDQDPEINYGEEEVCDGKDNNCNGRTDELLTRPCGTNQGICEQGIEQCRNGIWTGCTAKQPQTEQCGNYLDDDCDGEIDEGCQDPEDRKNELLLKNFITKEYGKDHDFNKALQAYRNTKDKIKIKKSSKIKEGKTEMKVKIETETEMKDVTIYELIPKSIAKNTDQIIFSEQPKIIQKDPLVAWHFAELSGSKEITYELKGKHEQAHEQTETIALSQETEEDLPWYILFLPVMIIPAAGFLFVVMIQLSKKHKE